VTNEVGKSVPATLFGTSGIRGRLDEFLTPEFAKKVSLSFAANITRHNNSVEEHSNGCSKKGKSPRAGKEDSVGMV